jgi:molybdopterin converting factor small subunit
VASPPTARELTVRFFAAARAAAAVDSVQISLERPTTIAEIIGQLSSRSADLARVLQRCSYLCDGIAVRDLEFELRPGQTLDVLPPFAGG